MALDKLLIEDPQIPNINVKIYLHPYIYVIWKIRNLLLGNNTLDHTIIKIDLVLKLCAC